jgi:hypothetical protein
MGMIQDYYAMIISIAPAHVMRLCRGVSIITERRKFPSQVIDYDLLIDLMIVPYLASSHIIDFNYYHPLFIILSYYLPYECTIICISTDSNPGLDYYEDLHNGS